MEGFLLAKDAVTVQAVLVTAEEAGILLVSDSVSADTQWEFFSGGSDLIPPTKPAKLVLPVLAAGGLGLTTYTLGVSSCWCLNLVTAYTRKRGW